MTQPGGLPPEVGAWVESVAGAAPTGVRRHMAGASRQAWALDVEGDAGLSELFLLRDTGRGGGSARDAAVLRALADTAVPVPAVLAADDELRTVLLERVPGRSDFPEVDDEGEREPTAAHLMEVAAELHRLSPGSLAIAHLDTPEPGVDHAAAQLASVEGVATMAGDGLHPVFGLALAWLRAHVPSGGGRTSLVHSDLGPGNFLARGGRVTALLDWEVAHWGDPMEDLAALAVRDMATPVGDLAARYHEYEAAGGPVVDLAAVAWYRVLVLVRNSMLIGLGLSFDDPATDRTELTMFRTLLMRAAAICLCDVTGVTRPVEAPFADAALDGPDRTELGLVTHARRDQLTVVEPALDDGFARRRAAAVGSVLGAVEHRIRFGPDRERRELAGLRAVLGHEPASIAAGMAEVGELADDEGRRPELVSFVAGSLVREAMLLEPLLGELFDRLPQPLEHP